MEQIEEDEKRKTYPDASSDELETDSSAEEERAFDEQLKNFETEYEHSSEISLSEDILDTEDEQELAAESKDILN